jgi:hypothetical protein
MILHAVMNASSSLWRAVPAYGAMDATTAAVTTHVYLIQAVALWVAAVVVVLVYGPSDLSRHPRQVASTSGRGAT